VNLFFKDPACQALRTVLDTKLPVRPPPPLNKFIDSLGNKPQHRPPTASTARTTSGASTSDFTPSNMVQFLMDRSSLLKPEDWVALRSQMLTDSEPPKLLDKINFQVLSGSDNTKIKFLCYCAACKVEQHRELTVIIKTNSKLSIHVTNFFSHLFPDSFGRKKTSTDSPPSSAPCKRRRASAPTGSAAAVDGSVSISRLSSISSSAELSRNTSSRYVDGNLLPATPSNASTATHSAGSGTCARSSSIKQQQQQQQQQGRAVQQQGRAVQHQPAVRQSTQLSILYERSRETTTAL
jgi:hypothetical protein